MLQARLATSTEHGFMAQSIFISYRKADDPGFTGRLYDRLKDKFTPARVFMDVTMRAGTEFEGELRRQVGACDVLLAIIGNNWLSAADESGARRLEKADDWVRIEIETALRAGKFVIPVLVNAARPPTKEELPRELQTLMGRQYERLSHEKFDTDAQALIASIEHALEEIRAQREREETARKTQADKLRAGQALSEADIRFRIGNAVVPDFGLRLVAQGPNGFPNSVGPAHSLYSCVGDYEELRGRFLSDILRDFYGDTSSVRGRWYAIKFRMPPDRLAEFGLLPATMEAVFHAATDFAELEGCRGLPTSAEAARTQFRHLARNVSHPSDTRHGGHFVSLGHPNERWASAAWHAVQSLRDKMPDAAKAAGWLSMNREDSLIPGGGHPLSGRDDAFFALLFGIHPCFGGHGRGYSEFAARHFFVRNLPLHQLDFEVQQLGTASDLVILA